MVSCCLTSTHKPGGWRRTWSLAAFGGLGVLLCGCTASIPNAPGHVVIVFTNQTDIDERLLAFLKLKLNLTDDQARALRPRIRMRVRITYVDGTFQTVEFIDGSPNLVDPAFDTQAFPDLNQNDLNNAVVVCDVARVEVEPGTNIEVFIPVELIQYQLVESTSTGGDTVVTFEQRGTLAPVFWPMQIDEVDQDGNVTLQRNIGVRDVPSPMPDVICGSVVAITVKGTLAVPFLNVVSQNTPSLDQDDLATVSRLGGRYEFNVTVQ
ncbi:MAG: hypothetical protein AAB385_00170 [Planctomycetota bacterium]